MSDPQPLPVLLARDRAPAPRTLLGIFGVTVREAPDDLAVDSGVETLTYAEFEDAAQQVAARLAEHGIGRGGRVGVRVKSGTTDLYRFGDYPFAGYTSVITDDDLEIPLESASLSTFGRNFASGAWDSVRLVAHELAHQWFGNAVTAGLWRDIWLHEGFACYAEWLWSEESGGKSAWQWAEYHHAILAEQRQPTPLSDPTVPQMFEDWVYKRGALTLQALRLAVGDDAFFEMLRTWVARHRGGTVTTAQFVALCEEIAGTGLGDLFDAWLHRTEMPELC